MDGLSQEKKEEKNELPAKELLSQTLKDKYPEATSIRLVSEVDVMPSTGETFASYAVFVLPYGIIRRSEESWQDLVNRFDL